MEKKDKILISASCVLGAAAITFASLFAWKALSGGGADNTTYHYVTFESNGGNHIETIKVKHNEKLIKPDDPDRLGYNFSNWCSDEGLSSEYNFDNLVTSDLTLYAKWIQFDIAAQFEIEAKANEEISFSCGEDDKFAVDWGDGSFDKNTSHTYAYDLTYIITIKGNLSTFAFHCSDIPIRFAHFYHVNSLSYRAFANHTNLQKVFLSDDLVTIDGNAFASCYGLTSVDIPSSVNSIGSFAFAGCVNLESVNFSNNIKSLDIDENTFLHCYKLKTVYIPDSITSISLNAFEDCPSLEYNEQGNVNYLGNSTHPYVAAMSTTDEGASNSYTLSNQCKIIFHNLFKESNLASITIPDNVTSIGNNAFDSCASLVNVTISDNSHLSTIGSGAFSNCTSLDTINVPNDIAYIGPDAFNNCFTTKTPTIYNNACYVSGNSNPYFILLKAENESITSCAIHENCKIISACAFQNRNSLISVSIPDGVLSIEYDAFKYCSELREVKISNNSKLTTIGDYVFHRCDSLLNIFIPDSVTSIGNGSLAGNSLKNITINDTSRLSSIGLAAFMFTDITSINIPNSVTFCGLDILGECPNLVPTAIYDNAYYFGNNENKYLMLWKAVNSSISSCEINKNCKFIHGNAFVNCNKLVSIDIPNGVTLIDDSAFSGCSSLASIDIPDSVTTIEKGAFSGCNSLTTLNISNDSHLSVIETEAFKSCDKLITINIPDNVMTIPKDAFANSGALTTITISEYSFLTIIGPYSYPGGAERVFPLTLTSFYIPRFVEYIHPGAFRYCGQLKTVTFSEESCITLINKQTFEQSSLFSINIPKSVKNIDEKAFDSCGSLEIIDLTSFMPGDEVPTLGDNALCDTNKKKIYVSDSILIDKLKGKGWPNDCPYVVGEPPLPDFN